MTKAYRHNLSIILAAVFLFVWNAHQMTHALNTHTDSVFTSDAIDAHSMQHYHHTEQSNHQSIQLDHLHLASMADHSHDLVQLVDRMFKTHNVLGTHTPGPLFALPAAPLFAIFKPPRSLT